MVRIEMTDKIPLEEASKYLSMGDVWNRLVAKREKVSQMFAPQYSEMPLRVDTAERLEGMSPSQQVEHYLLNWLGDSSSEAAGREKNLENWVKRNKEKGFALYPREERAMYQWIDAVIGRSLVDHGRKKGKLVENSETEYFKLVQKTESLWRKIEDKGLEVKVNILNPRGSKLVSREVGRGKIVDSVVYDEGPIDKFMNGFNKRFGPVFAAITGISLVVASVDAACTNAQPTNLPPETALVPTGTSIIDPTAEKTPTPMSAVEAQTALDKFLLPGPTSFPDQQTEANWNNGEYGVEEASLNVWAKVWIKNRIIFDQPLVVVMADPAKYNSIHIEVRSGADGTSFLCMRTTSPDLPDCYIQPIDPATGRLYETVPSILPSDTFIALQTENRPDGLKVTSYERVPALMDNRGNIKKVLGLDSKWHDLMPPTSIPEITMHAGIPATIEQCDVLHPETPGYAEEMRQRRAVDRAALGGINRDVVFSSDYPNMYYPDLPLDYKEYGIPMSWILSCSTYDRGGERIIRFGIATGPNTMMYIDYDELAAMNLVKAWPHGNEQWEQRYSFEALFAKMATGEEGWLTFGVFYDSRDAPAVRPSQEFGFEGVWEFIDSPLKGPLMLNSKLSGTEVTIYTHGDLALVSHLFEYYDEASVQKILEALEKYVWPGSIICF
jgi:hypothetical protein